jgi:hypothetical protein
MKIIKIKGGLGNQLFQYAFARYFGIQNKIEVKIDNGVNTNKQDTYRQYSLENFNITLPLASQEEVQKNKYPYGIFSKLMRGIKAKIFRIYNIGYKPNILKTKENYLEGFWQSYKYLDPIRDTILKEISLKEPIENKYTELLEQISNSNSVSMHIRRGDYINNPKTKSAHYTFGMEYYKQAIKIIKDKISNPNFFVFSDDIDWAKENIQTNSPTTFVSNLEIKDYEELFIMSKCKHNIIANSSFSFWGAWLNQNPNKIVIAPKKWNNKYQSEYRDLLLSDWLKI